MPAAAADRRSHCGGHLLEPDPARGPLAVRCPGRHPVGNGRALASGCALLMRTNNAAGAGQVDSSPPPTVMTCAGNRTLLYSGNGEFASADSRRISRSLCQKYQATTTRMIAAIG